MSTQVCRQCGIEKRLDEDFYRRPDTRSGYHSTCKDCMSRRATLWRKAHPEQAANATQRWRDSHPEQYRASLAARNAQKRARYERDKA